MPGACDFLRLVRERRERSLGRARSVAEAAQLALLRPPPRRIGPLRIAWLYLTAEDESQIGGDLFAVARASGSASRVLIGDVRGKGLGAIAEASVVLGAFREGARRYPLPALTAALQDSVDRDLEGVADTEYDLGEHFITALVLDVADDHPEVEMISCGHPPPLLLHGGRVTTVQRDPPRLRSGCPRGPRRRPLRLRPRRHARPLHRRRHRGPFTGGRLLPARRTRRDLPRRRPRHAAAPHPPRPSRPYRRPPSRRRRPPHPRTPPRGAGNGALKAVRSSH
ncbi:SpoIIE family protein phosphatase [Actinomadura sp. LD22]|uniref:SpoIIE family protein phosphatase n=1 Tax=Actinomadura physcomitrii TaxID=2650748 RepID=A0A6I4M795_9ACTN|nr:SpoIIE family protein phosphatase [Actinomadura physcomitrii]